ncbi:hypothetical protein Bca4012_020674 [Brassica carinata]|uniref:Uncharacterized protein n=1 Tax=Brassica carinata TaxID=52824 RepID=A0A8X7WI59_BRACI|nr:hypothetical protein Bca52824_000972 [Brassica carinata]
MEKLVRHILLVLSIKNLKEMRALYLGPERCGLLEGSLNTVSLFGLASYLNELGMSASIRCSLSQAIAAGNVSSSSLGNQSSIGLGWSGIVVFTVTLPDLPTLFSPSLTGKSRTKYLAIETQIQR